MNYLKRYRNGEYKQVWNEMTALGPAVRQKRYYSQACAVATETMRRVRGNCELLVSRLRDAGYILGTYPDGSGYLDPPDPLVSPSKETRAAIAEFEEQNGPLPLSLTRLQRNDCAQIDLIKSLVSDSGDNWMVQ